MSQEANANLIAHQQGMEVEEKILRHFDLSSQYGVCCLVSPRVLYKKRVI